MLSYKDYSSPYDAFGLAGLALLIFTIAYVDSAITALVCFLLCLIVGLLIVWTGMRHIGIHKLRDRARQESFRDVVAFQLRALVFLTGLGVVGVVIASLIGSHTSLAIDPDAVLGGGVSGVYCAVFVAYLVRTSRG